ncbi:SnoK [Dictyobacter alpinus]|uniref:SnoK n=1 Tax=Dictyobacter alpinus TaxID=2014873 RepID=A0A402B748_9CHLR|nr:phytanoyl-CoA dioxygenase family protein [Dictyobacter alpinus]GCE27130.1 SnoK [Dictyobacter alpinus]
MLTTEQQQQFNEQGFFILPQAFPAGEIDALRAHIDHFAAKHEQQLQERGKEGISRPNEISFTFNLAAHDPAIMQFVTQEKFVQLTSDLLKDDISLYWDQAVYKKPEAKRDFPWHQDTGYTLTDPAEYVTCWLALDETTLDNGCIWVIPGSHKQGAIEHTDTEIGKQCYFGTEPGIPVPLKKGGMVAFSSLLFHRSGPNISNTVRKGYVIQYSVSSARHGVSGEPFNRIVIARNGQAALA